MMNEDVTPNPGKPPLLTVVVPCYNEQDAVHEIVRKLKKDLVDIASRGEIAGDSAILFVDDGSSDDTWSLIVRYAANDSAVHGLSYPGTSGTRAPFSLECCGPAATRLSPWMLISRTLRK